MNMLKVLKLSVLPLLVFNSPAFAAGSPTSPFASGKAYYDTTTKVCNIPSSPPVVKTVIKEGQKTFTASSSPYVTWLGTQGFVSTPPLSNTTNKNVIDDSANNSVSTSYLTESVIQWGTMSGSQKAIGFYQPSGAAQAFSFASINDIIPLVIVSFNYLNTNSPSPVITKGYAVYSYSSSPAGWDRHIVNFGAFTSSAAATQLSYIDYKADTEWIGGVQYPSYCYTQGKLSQ